MRLALLALIFLLVLTLGNAYLLKRERAYVAAHDYAPLQLRRARTGRYERYGFAWREIGAVVLTVLVFGGIQALAGSSTHER